MNLLRMNALVVANRESPHPFTMRWFTWPSTPCGTPACLLGNYAARTDLQSDFRMDPRLTRILANWGTAPFTSVEIAEHFDLSRWEIEALFGSKGCGGAGENREKALAYVEAFIARKLAERPAPQPDDEEDEDEEIEATA